MLQWAFSIELMLGLDVGMAFLYRVDIKVRCLNGLSL